MKKNTLKLIAMLIAVFALATAIHIGDGGTLSLTAPKTEEPRHHWRNEKSKDYGKPNPTPNYTLEHQRIYGCTHKHPTVGDRQ